jgi:MFS transporter, AAHS family, benzoate transport protein
MERVINKVDMEDLVDNAKFNNFHWMLLAITGLIIIFDGYDLIIYGVVLPKLMAEWKIDAITAGALGSYALFGMMFGAFIFGSLADKFGRKKLIIFCVALFSIVTFFTGFASNPTEFGFYRFIAGLGIGGVMPNAVALITEYAPKRMRSMLVTIMFSGYAVGGMLAAGLGIWLIPQFGWPSVFFVGIIPLILLPLFIMLLPDSPAFLIKDGNQKILVKVANALNPNGSYTSEDTFIMPEHHTKKGHFTDLFKENRLFSTLMIWIAFFCCLLIVYAMTGWLPKLMMKAGFPLGSSLTFLMVLSIGSIIGALLGGYLADKFNPRSILMIFFALAAISITLLGQLNSFILLNLFVAITGATTIGTQIILYAYVAQYYPTTVKGTGIGWASAIGRTGAIFGPILGGVLVAANVSLTTNFIAFAIPAVVAFFAISMVGKNQNK